MLKKFSLARCAAAFVAVMALSGLVRAADEQLTGNIIVVTDTGFAMQLRSGTPMLVTVNDETKIRQTNDDAHMAKTDLLPGLEVDVDGTIDGTGRLVAQHVRFSKEDLQHALEVKAALTPLEQAIARNTGAIQEIAQKLGMQIEAANQYAGALDRVKADLAVATSGRVPPPSPNLANLNDYNVVDTMTIYFANGSAKLPKGTMAEVAAFAAKAKGVPAYRIAVEGHASAVGNIPYNTTLSHLRAEAVTAALQQQGVPTANVFVPAALGTTMQVAENKTAKGQAQNRRVVITILQNKGMAGK